MKKYKGKIESIGGDVDMEDVYPVVKDLFDACLKKARKQAKGNVNNSCLPAVEL